MRDAALLLLGLLGWCGACAPAPEAQLSASPDGAAADGCGQAPCSDALPARTWRLTHTQYARAVQQLTGVAPDTAGFEPELDNGVYPNMSGSGMVDAVLAHDYYESAERIASQMPTPQLRLLSQLEGAAPLTRAGKPAFLSAALRGAFRRPPSQEELQVYAELFDAEPDSEPDGSSPFRAVIRALLSSPYFLYRTELGSDPASARFSLTSYELASLLAFSLQDSPPSAALLAAAESGVLSQPARLHEHIEALLDAPEATSQLSNFLRQWLEIQRFDELAKDLALFPDFAEHKPDMWAEATRFLGQVGSMSGTIPALLTTPVALSPESIAYYVTEPSAAGAAGTRTGVMGLAAVIASHSRLNGTSPTLSGLFVRERMLCQSVHLPPGGAPNIADTLFAKQPRTTRELYAQHALDPTCAGCHVLLDSIGFNFEDFDATGRHRTLENGAPIDSSGELVEPQVGGPTRDHTQLAQRLASSDAVRLCFARQAFRFYFGLVEPSDALPAVQAAYHAAMSGTLRELVSQLIQTQVTRMRVRVYEGQAP